MHGQKNVKKISTTYYHLNFLKCYSIQQVKKAFCYLIGKYKKDTNSRGKTVRCFKVLSFSMKPSRALCTCFYHFIRNKPASLKTLAGSQSELYRIFVPAGGTEGRRAVISTFRILRGKGGMEGSEEGRESNHLEGFMRTNVCVS